MISSCRRANASRHVHRPARKLLWCRRREEQSVKLRKTAEKLLMNQLKKHALKNMSGSQQMAVLAQAKQTQAAAAEPSPSDDIPADLLVPKPMQAKHTSCPALIKTFLTLGTCTGC